MYGRELVEVRLPRHLDVHAQAIGPPAGFSHQMGAACVAGERRDLDVGTRVSFGTVPDT